jgi:hypothetical protein
MNLKQHFVRNLDEFITVSQTAQLLHIPESAVWQKVIEGTIASVNVGGATFVWKPSLALR